MHLIERLDVDAWMRFDEEHPAPTFFARPAWALALARTYRHITPNPLLIRIAGARLIVPLVRLSGGPLRWRELRGSPLGAYTFISRDDGTPATSDEIDAVMLALTHAGDTANVIPWPLGPQPRPSPRWKQREHDTAVIDLSNGADAALAGLRGISRRMSGQAQRRGVVVQPYAQGDAVERYWEMLTQASQRWGLSEPPVPRALIENVCAAGGRNVEIWFAYHDDEPIAGGLVFYGSQEFFFWSAAMRHEFARLRPSNALNVALIQNAAARGMRWYNLGSSEGLPGVARFKQDLGARTIAYPEYEYVRPAYALYTNVRDAFTRATL